MGKFQDLTGMKFGRLTVLKRGENKSGRETIWICECDCGNIKIVHGADLKRGHTKSCGCYKIERTSVTKSTHKKRNSRLYNIWSNMKQRCTNPNNDRAKDYGARGITVCKEWIHDFQAFYDWAMESGYRDDLTLDRKDVNGNYEPSNCRWATYKEQANNKRNNVVLSYKGEQKTLGEWAEEIGMEYDTLHARIFIQKMSVEQALNNPLKKGM